jgi:SpoVK/Ycf46/Vps4 family AAA+-type ATPase
VREDLVVPAETQRELELALAWGRHREWLSARSTEGHNMLAGRGLACLFTGPPGTGKTMGAQVLARAMELDLYRIDLSQVVSKYIGETEKNLTRVFDEARAANVVLFFDEADALFGKRTEVKDAHDRYANVETGFLLQRIEQHDGICILATNLRRNMDEAFLRRLHVVADFPMPGEGERRRIWQRHLPAARCLPDIDLDFLARRFAVSGGEIRNAVVTAVLLSAGTAGVAMRHLVIGLWRELRKAGRIVDAAELGPWAAAVLPAAVAAT